ncbi:MAG: hypothetical protein MJ191_05730 [Clostridium sp.]|nr:hypothetical protein [Clostridium sp.]
MYDRLQFDFYNKLKEEEERNEIKRVICLFEQSGTFKTAAKQLGYESFDYDIENQFNETDYVIDLFNEIDKAYNNKKSIFDEFNENDIILCFFPCTRFSKQALLSICCNQSQLINKSITEKLDHNIMELFKLLNVFYYRFVEFYQICIDKGLKAIIENPFDTQSFLYRYFPIKPTIIDYNRMEWGDYFKKPTMYYFINWKVKNTLIMEQVDYKQQLKVNEMPKGIKRSLISKDYALRFIKEFIK